MKLPNFQNAFVPPEKLANYLLSEIHSVGRSKALFLKNLGYDDSDTAILAQDLLTIAREEDVSVIRSSEFGTKYVIEGLMRTPNGSLVAMRTVWIIGSIDLQPRLVTAYPV